MYESPFCDTMFDCNGFTAQTEKNIVVTFKAKSTKDLNEILNLLGSKDGLHKTVTFEGCIYYDVFTNKDKLEVIIVSRWRSSEYFEKYIHWRTHDDKSGVMTKLQTLSLYDLKKQVQYAMQNDMHVKRYS